MRIKRMCKLYVDIAMLALTIFLMASERTGIVLHMFMGAVLFVLLVVHNALNLSWWAGIGKGTYNRIRWVRTIWNIMLLIDFLLVMTSGILYAVGLHRITALLFFFLTAIHIRVHWEKDSMKKRNE